MQVDQTRKWVYEASRACLFFFFFLLANQAGISAYVPPTVSLQHWQISGSSTGQQPVTIMWSKYKKLHYHRAPLSQILAEGLSYNGDKCDYYWPTLKYSVYSILSSIYVHILRPHKMQSLTDQTTVESNTRNWRRNWISSQFGFTFQLCLM